VTRRTLYYHFASKEALVGAYLTRRDAAGRALVAGNADVPPARRLLAVFDELERWFRTRSFRGCALTNAVAEKGETVVVAGRITLRHKRALRDWFVATCAAAGCSAPADLGEQLMVLFDGALTSATTRREPKAASHARAAAATLLRAHGVFEEGRSR
jgi:AcrR family transcriptional regulator